MKPSFLIRLAIAFGAAVWFVAAVVFGASVDENWILKTLGAVTTAAVVVWTAFDLWLWRLLPTRLSKRPKLWGTWKASMDSHWTDPATGVECPRFFGHLSVGVSAPAGRMSIDGWEQQGQGPVFV